MRSIARSIVFYGTALYLSAQVIDGVIVSGGFWTYLVGGIILSLLFIIVKPVLSIITLPLNVITLGLFTFLINAIILYLLTVLAPNIAVNAFMFKGAEFLGFIAPVMEINAFFAFILTSVFISVIIGFLKWLTKK